MDYQYTIKPPKRLVNINLPEIWRFRDLFYIFVWRDIKVRYKQTVLGILWVVFQPLLTMIIFTIFFGRLANMPSNDIPYPIFVYSGLLFWNYYSTALTNSSNCLVENEGIVKKVYFPRLILPLSSTITPIIDFLFALVILFILMFYYQYVPSIMGIFLLPILLIMSFISAAGLGLFFSAVNIKYRDVRYALPFFIQMLMFLSPVIYPVNIIPERYQWLLYLNPMTGVITLARNSLLVLTNTEWQYILISLASAGALFLFGLYYFKKTERFFADIL